MGGIPTFNLLDQFIVSRGLYYGHSGLRMKRQTVLRPAQAPGGQPIEVELGTVEADMFDADVMITSAATRPPKGFDFSINEDGMVTHNAGFSNHFPIVTTIETIP